MASMPLRPREWVGGGAVFLQSEAGAAVLLSHRRWRILARVAVSGLGGMAPIVGDVSQLDAAEREVLGDSAMVMAPKHSSRLLVALCVEEEELAGGGRLLVCSWASQRFVLARSMSVGAIISLYLLLV